MENNGYISDFVRKDMGLHHDVHVVHYSSASVEILTIANFCRCCDREAVKQLKGFQDESQQRHAEFVDCDATKQSLQRTVVSQQEKLEKITLQHRVKEDSMKLELNERLK